MNSYIFKFSKIKSLEDYDEKCEKNKLQDLDEKINQTMKDMSRVILNPSDSTLFINILLREYFSRVKLEKEISLACQHESSISQKLSKLKKKLKARKSMKEDSDAKKALRSNLLQIYEENFSMKIQSIKEKMPNCKDEEAVSFDFYNIDEKNPQKTYSFILIIDGITYKVVNCSPPVKEIKDLLSALNKTNDLRSFIIKMRKCFMEMSSI